MPHQCVHCSALYEEGASETINGCAQCGGRFFFRITEERKVKLTQMKEAQRVEQTAPISTEEKEQIEQDVREIAGISESEAPIVLDFETVKVLQPGKYMIDIAQLFKKEGPLVVKLDDGKYFIDLANHTPKKR